MKWVLMAAALLVASFGSATARTTDDHCRFYFGEEEDIPPEIETIISEIGGAVSLCGRSGQALYHLVSRPSQAPFSVCQVTQWRLTKEAATLEFTPSKSSSPGFPTLLMTVAEGDCPRQDDPRYIPTENVTAGIFVAVFHFWEEISSSEDGLESVLATFRKHGVSEHFSRDLEDFEKDFRNGEVELSAVRLGGNDKRTAPYFAMELGRSGTYWSLLVDFEGDELVVLGLGMTIVD